MKKKEEQLSAEELKKKALKQFMSGESLYGKNGAFAPMIKSFLESALEGELDAHLDDEELTNDFPKLISLRPELEKENNIAIQIRICFKPAIIYHHQITILPMAQLFHQLRDIIPPPKISYEMDSIRGAR